MEKNYTAKCNYDHINDSGLGGIVQIHQHDDVIIKADSIDDVYMQVNTYLKDTPKAVFAANIMANVTITDDNNPDFELKFRQFSNAV